MSLRLFYTLALAAIFVPAANAMTIDSLVARVFPFKAGQRYEFKSRLAFQDLPPYTEVEFTITDTVINGVTWLRIPYWSPFGCGLYRLDESYRVLMLVRGGTFTLIDLQYLNGLPPSLKNARWADSYDAPCFGYSGRAGGGFDVWNPIKTTVTFSQRGGVLSDSAYHAAVVVFSTWEGIDAVFNVYGLGSCLHATVRVNPQTGELIAGENCSPPCPVYLSLFRAKTDDPWPTFLDKTTAIRQNPQPERKGIRLSAVPNPFNSSVLISYSTSLRENANVSIYTATGQLVRRLKNGGQEAGLHNVIWDGRDNSNRPVASGVYIISLRAGNSSSAIRVTIAR